MLRLELERRLSRWPLWVVSLSVGLLLMISAQLAVPQLPATGKQFVMVAFDLRGLGDFILLNDYLTVYAIPFFTGMVALQDVLLRPREEGLLEVLLSKPITRRTYWYSGTVAVLLLAMGQGLVLAVACVVATVLDGTGAVGPAMALAGAVVALAVAMVALVVTHVVSVWVRDSLTAVVVGFVVWIAPLLGTTVFLYRPDLLTGPVRDVLAFPVNAVWLADQAWTVPIVLAGLLGGAGLVTWLSGWLFERVELR